MSFKKTKEGFLKYNNMIECGEEKSLKKGAKWAKYLQFVKKTEDGWIKTLQLIMEQNIKMFNVALIYVKDNELA